MKKILVATCLSVASLSLHAESGFSLSGLLGSANQTFTRPDDHDPSGRDVSFGVRGAYSFNEYIALEAGYHNYGEADDSHVDSFGDDINDKITTNALAFGVKGSLPFDNGLGLVARAGVASWKWELEVTNSKKKDMH